MSTPTIDYDALAKKYGAVSSAAPSVDYDALAKQHGAISSTPAPAQATEQAAPQKPWYQMTMHELAQAGVGFLKSAYDTADNVSTVMRGGIPVKLPEALTPERYPQGTSQKVGAGIEQG